MDKIILKILFWFVSKKKNSGVNFDQLKIITETKLLMDKRRVPVSWKKKQQTGNNNTSMIIGYLMYGLMSLFVGVQILLMPSLIFSMIIFHSYLLFVMAMTLITDFSAVLLDTADNNILVPKPINSRTLFLSRVIHITTYLLKYFIALSLFPIVFSFIKYGLLVGIATILTSLLTVTFAVFATYILYGLILRFGNEQKIKDVVGYFQIFMTIVFVAGFQIVPRLMDFTEKFTFTTHTYTYFIPAAWMAFFLEGLSLLHFDKIHLIMTACCFLIPVFTLWFMMKYLAPSFSRKLNALGNTGDGSLAKAGDKNISPKNISVTMSKVFCRGNEEVSGFKFVWKVTGRDKGFKIGFYPSIAYLFIFFFITVFNRHESFQFQLQHLFETKKYLFLVYIPVFMSTGALALIPFYENFSASWLYQALPLQKPGSLINGGVKAVIVKFFLPFFLLMFSVAFYIWGFAIIDDFLLGFFNDVLIFYVITLFSDNYLPFTQKPGAKQQGGKFARAILNMIVIGMLIGLHYAALKIIWLPAALISLPIIAIYFLQKKLQQLSWQKIKI